MRLQRHVIFNIAANYYLSLLLIILAFVAMSGCSGEKPGNGERESSTETSSESGIEAASFFEITVEGIYDPPEIAIEIGPDERPRLICDNRTAQIFSQERGTGHYEAVVRMSRDLWSQAGKQNHPADPVSPGYIAVAAHATVNKEYLALALQEIDRALVPEGGLDNQDALEALTWAAIGMDTISLQVSDLDRNTIFDGARNTLDRLLLLELKKELPDGNAAFAPNAFFAKDGDLARAYSAAFLWELTISESPEKWKELLTVAHPVLTGMQDSLREALGEAGFEFINGPIDDGMYLAIMAWEHMAGADMLDRELLRLTIDRAMEYCRVGFVANGVEHFSTVEGNAALMHLAKWRTLLNEQELAELNGWVEPGDYSPQALMHVFLKPLID